VRPAPVSKRLDYEPHGARGTAVLRFGQPVARAEAVDLLGESTDDPPVVIEEDGRTVRVPFRPFQVVTLRLGSAPA